MAITFATNGDTIYLPGGEIDNSSVDLTKSISLMGAGYNSLYTTATASTIFKNNFSIEDVNNVYITGVQFENNLYLDNAQSIFLERCWIGVASDLLRLSNSSIVLAQECIIENLSSLSNCVVLAQNCVIEDLNQATSSSFNNCILFEESTSNTGFWPSVTNSTFTNNIICTSGLIYQEDQNSYTHNVFTDSVQFGGGVVQNNNVFRVGLTSLFVNVPDINSFDEAYDYHLSNTSPAIGAGLNGADCGIYGGLDPFKAKGLPFNPHIESIFIPATTDANGDLHINATVEAQDR
tara:strand:- start:4888 stop:5763 length:876 start_codon:yes stop_codon:yes gene_type:complete